MSAKNTYSASEVISNGISLVYTKLFYKGARLIRRPIFLRGKKYLEYKHGLTTGYNCRIEMFNTGKGSDKKLTIGKNCKMGDYVHIAAGESVKIGDNVLMGSKILISDLNHGNYSQVCKYSNPEVSPDKRPIHTRPVVIGNNVWIGDNACILAGVTVGDGCIVGANSVVNKNVDEKCIVAGVPAKVIKKYDDKLEKWIKV